MNIRAAVLSKLRVPKVCVSIAIIILVHAVRYRYIYMNYRMPYLTFIHTATTVEFLHTPTAAACVLVSQALMVAWSLPSANSFSTSS